MRFCSLVAAVAAFLNLGSPPVSAESTYTPLKEVDARVREGNLLSQWLRGEFRDPYSDMLVIFPAREGVGFCETLVFERNEAYSIRGSNELLEADFGDYRSVTFDLKGGYGTDSEASLSMPSPQGMVTIHFSDLVTETAPTGAYFKAEAEKICVSPIGAGYCNPAGENVAPLYVAGLNSKVETRHDYVCSYFMYLNSKE